MAEYVAGRGTTALGIIGTALGGLSALGGLGGMMAHAAPMDGSNTYVTRYEMQMAQQLAAKDSEIALIKSEQNTEVKIADVYERIMTRVNADKNEQNAINMNQAVLNATQTGAIASIQRQVDILNCLTKVVVPNSSICPGWGEVKVEPVAPTAG